MPLRSVHVVTVARFHSFLQVNNNFCGFLCARDQQMFFSGDVFLFSSLIPLFLGNTHFLRRACSLGDLKRPLVQPPGVYDEEAEAWPGKDLCEAVPSLVPGSQRGLDPGSPRLPRALPLLRIVCGVSWKNIMIFSLSHGRTKQTRFLCSLPLAPLLFSQILFIKREALSPVA